MCGGPHVFRDTIREFKVCGNGGVVEGWCDERRSLQRREEGEESCTPMFSQSFLFLSFSRSEFDHDDVSSSPLHVRSGVRGEGERGCDRFCGSLVHFTQTLELQRGEF